MESFDDFRIGGYISKGGGPVWAAGMSKVSRISFLRSYMNQRKKTTLDIILENSRAIKSNKKNYLENGFVYHRFLKSMSQYQSQYTDSVVSF